MIRNKFLMRHAIAIEKHNVITGCSRNTPVENSRFKKAPVGLPQMLHRRAQFRFPSLNQFLCAVSRAIIRNKDLIRQKRLQRERSKNLFERLPLIVSTDDER